MSKLTAVMALKALDGLSMRADVTSQNIANASSPGYRPLKVSFEQALVDASTQGRAAVDAVQPSIESDPNAADSTGVRLDMEMATASMTSARYAALIEIMSRQGQHMRAVVES